MGRVDQSRWTLGRFREHVRGFAAKGRHVTGRRTQPRAVRDHTRDCSWLYSTGDTSQGRSYGVCIMGKVEMSPQTADIAELRG